MGAHPVGRLLALAICSEHVQHAISWLQAAWRWVAWRPRGSRGRRCWQQTPRARICGRCGPSVQASSAPRAAAGAAGLKTAAHQFCMNTTEAVHCCSPYCMWMVAHCPCACYTGELCAYMPEERGSEEQQLLYGRVTADARPPAGQPLHRVPLEVRSTAEWSPAKPRV
jgi:hypothetical protein